MMQSRQRPDPFAPAFLLPLCAAAIFSTISCVHNAARIAPAIDPSADNSYMDLAPGGRLRILVPILKSGEHQVTMNAKSEEGHTIVLSAANLLGYEVSYYAIEGRSDGKVRLKFTSAEITKEGKTAQESEAPALPFPLPLKSQHIRLIYLIRSSQSDHNMAIAASRNPETLEALTNRLKVNPGACQSDSKVFCSWVPAGVAVRPESLPAFAKKSTSRL